MVVLQLGNRPRQGPQIQSQVLQLSTGLSPTSIIYPLTLFVLGGVVKLIRTQVGMSR